jgi:hypothetical protein
MHIHWLEIRLREQAHSHNSGINRIHSLSAAPPWLIESAA